MRIAMCWCIFIIVLVRKTAAVCDFQEACAPHDSLIYGG
jgi:hypothetical protein